MIDDDTLIRSVKSGHSADFEPIIRRYEQKMIHFIYRLTRDREEARNLAQDTFLKVFDKIQQYRCDGKFPAFLFRIARNLTINHLRRENRKSLFSSFFRQGSPDQYLQDHDTPDRNLASRESEERLKSSIRSLKPDQHTALVMKFHQGYSYKQIAVETGWSIPKIETLVYRAKKNLRKKIKYARQ